MCHGSQRRVWELVTGQSASGVAERRAVLYLGPWGRARAGPREGLPGAAAVLELLAENLRKLDGGRGRQENQCGADGAAMELVGRWFRQAVTTSNEP